MEICALKTINLRSIPLGWQHEKTKARARIKLELKLELELELDRQIISCPNLGLILKINFGL